MCSILLNLFIYSFIYLFIYLSSFRWLTQYASLCALLQDSENWTIKTRHATRITAAEMKYMRITAGYTWTDHKTNTEIAKELNTAPVLDKIQDYKRNCTQHVNRMIVIDCTG